MCVAVYIIDPLIQLSGGCSQLWCSWWNRFIHCFHCFSSSSTGAHTLFRLVDDEEFNFLEGGFDMKSPGVFFWPFFFCYYFMMKTWIAWISSTSLISVLSCIPLFQRGIPFKPSPLWFISFWLGEMMIWVSDLNSHLFPIEGTHLFTKL